MPAGGDEVAHGAGRVAEQKQRDVIAANRSADREKRVRDLQRKEGWTRRQAEEFVDREARVTKLQREQLTSEERQIRKTRSIESDMGARKKVHGHGSGSAKSKFKQQKTGTFVCRECHLEFCHHRQKRARGRPATDRSERVGARVSKKTRGFLRRTGLTASELLTVTMQYYAARDMRPFSDVIAEAQRRKRRGEPIAA